jgi:hypothetical protein
MPELETQVRALLRDVADEMPAHRDVPPDLDPRARRRIIRTIGATFAAVVVLVTGVAVALDGLPVSDPPLPGERPTPTPPGPSTPSPRGYHRLVDAGDHGVLLLWGASLPGPADETTVPDPAWSFTDPGGGWANLGVADVPPLNDAVYDSESGLVVLLAPGLTSEGQEAGASTFVYDPSTRRIRQMGAGGPTGLIGVRAAYDAESDRVIAFGGLTPGSGYSDETWSYDVDTDTWTLMHPDAPPSPRNFVAMAYDPGVDRVILFDGRGLADTWAYDLEADTWSELSPATNPGARLNSAMVYEPIAERLVLFGGTRANVANPRGDTWAFDAVTNAWTELRTPTGPSPRGWHAMAFDPRDEVILLFGGGPNRNRYTAETWVFDPVAETWTLVE